MKLLLLRIANAALRPVGVHVYHEGLDMESAIRRLAPLAGSIGTVRHLLFAGMKTPQRIQR